MALKVMYACKQQQKSKNKKANSKQKQTTLKKNATTSKEKTKVKKLAASKISKQIAFELTQAAPQRLCY